MFHFPSPVSCDGGLIGRAKKKSKGPMSQLIHVLGMKLQDSVSIEVAEKVILVTHLEAIV